jgi:hypothetical protein
MKMVDGTENRKERRKQRIQDRQQRTMDALFRAERDAVLRSLDVQQMQAFMIKWKQPVPSNWGKPDAALGVMHRARLALPTFNYEEKLVSAMWLVAHQYPLPVGIQLVDGVLVGVANVTTSKH